MQSLLGRDLILEVDWVFRFQWNLDLLTTKKNLKNLRRRLCLAIQAEHTRKPNLKLKLPSDIELKASD